MLYLIGGAARAGKTILARQICAGQAAAHISIDKVIAGLVTTMPELGLEIRDPARTRAEIVWPVLRVIAAKAALASRKFLLEGDALLPSQVAGLIQARPGAVKACFIGYALANPETKLYEIRRYAAGRDDWTHELDDSALLELIETLRIFSEYLRSECREHGVAYFDASDRFAAALQDAEVYIHLPSMSARQPAPQPAQSSLRFP
ncbi:MAG: hypothetical protein ACYDC3_18510 [Candidatus Binataceae bacterium]